MNVQGQPEERSQGRRRLNMEPKAEHIKQIGHWEPETKDISGKAGEIKIKSVLMKTRVGVD